MDQQLKTNIRTQRDMGQFVTNKLSASAEAKLRNHSRVQHSGVVLESCPACQELLAASTKEAKHGQ